MVSSFSVTSASRLLIAVLLVWLLVIFFITGPIFKWPGKDESHGENGEMILARLSRATSELNSLKAQNEELRNLLQNYLPAEFNAKLQGNNLKDISKQIGQEEFCNVPSQEVEDARRRIIQNLNELWYYLRTRTNSSFMEFINQQKHNMNFDLGAKQISLFA